MSPREFLDKVLPYALQEGLTATLQPSGTVSLVDQSTQQQSTFTDANLGLATVIALADSSQIG